MCIDAHYRAKKNQHDAQTGLPQVLFVVARELLVSSDLERRVVVERTAEDLPLHKDVV